MKGSRLWLLCASAWVLGGCNTPSPSERAGVDSAGTRIWQADAADRPAPWRVTTVRRLADVDSAHPLHLVRFPGAIAGDTGGRLFVLNEVAERVEVFDANGDSLGIRGRRGGGPGEYQFPGWLHAEENGELAIVDFGKSALVRFALDGSPLPERSLLGLGHPHGGVRLRGDTVVIYDRSIEENRPVHALRLVTPSSTSTLASITLPAASARFQCPGFSFRMNGTEQFFAPQIQWTFGHGLLAVGRTDRYDVHVLDGTALKYVFRRPLERTRASIEHVERRHPEGLLIGGPSCRKSAAELAEQFGIAETLPVIGSLVFAPDGVLWIERFRLPGDERLMDLFSLTEGYLGSLSVPAIPIRFTTNGTVIGLVPDEDSDGFRVVTFRLEPASP